MATQSVTAMIVDHPREVNDDGDNSDCYIFSTPLSSRGSTKRDAISVEDYDLERNLRIRFKSSHQTTVKSESPPIYIDLDDEDDDEVTDFINSIERDSLRRRQRP